MKTFILFSLITLLTGNPLLALAILLLAYFFIDRRFIGILPDIGASWRRARRAGELERIVRANPHNGDALLELGVLYFEKKQFHRSVEVLARAYDRMKDWPDVHFYLGAACCETGDTLRGLSEITQAVSVNPKIGHGYPYIYLIRAILEKGKDGDGELRDLIASLLRYGSVQAFYKAGQVFRRYGRESEAGTFFREVLENYRLSSPTFRRVYRKMALLSRYYQINSRG